MKSAVRTAMWMHRCAINIGDQSSFLSSAKRGFPFVLSSSCISQEKLAIHLLYFTAPSFTEMWELTWTCAVERRFAPFLMYQSLREELVQACSMGNMGWAPSPPFLPCISLTGHWKFYTGLSLPFPLMDLLRGLHQVSNFSSCFIRRLTAKCGIKPKFLLCFSISIGYKPTDHSFGLIKFL